jgi:small redox-active disulfide protein 2
MEIKVLGSGCSNCKKLFANAKQAVEELGVEATVTYVTDYMEIAKTGILRTPGLIINGKITSYGRVILVDELKAMIKKAL